MRRAPQSALKSRGGFLGSVTLVCHLFMSGMGVFRFLLIGGTTDFVLTTTEFGDRGRSKSVRRHPPPRPKNPGRVPEQFATGVNISFPVSGAFRCVPIGTDLFVLSID